MGALVHPSAVVHRSARLGADVQIGPFCLVGADAELGDGVVLHSHVVVTGHTRIGARTTVFPFAALGHAPQDLKFRGERTTLSIGPDCILREGVTIHPGTQGGGGGTALGRQCVLLAHAHVGHDCRIGERVVLSNNVMLAGHVRIDAGAILGGGVGVHQFVRIGEHAFVGGLSGLEGDLVPFGLAIGNRARLAGLNLVGLRRLKAPRKSIRILQSAVERLFAGGRNFAQAVEELAGDCGGDPFAEKLLSFVKQPGKRPFCRPARA